MLLTHGLMSMGFLIWYIINIRNFTKERLIKFYGIYKEKFPLHLKEIELRCDNKKKDLIGLLTPKI
jgi:transposase-like protein